MVATLRVTEVQVDDLSTATLKMHALSAFGSFPTHSARISKTAIKSRKSTASFLAADPPLYP